MTNILKLSFIQTSLEKQCLKQLNLLLSTCFTQMNVLHFSIIIFSRRKCKLLDMCNFLSFEQFHDYFVNYEL